MTFPLGFTLEDKSLQHFIAGTVAGTASTVCLYPIELLKTRIQVTSRSSKSYHSITKAFNTVVNNEGVLGLYKGIWPAVVASSGSWGGYFYIYELSKQRKLAARNGNGILGLTDHLQSATEAGVAMVLVFNPMWVIRTRMALQGIDSKTSAPHYKGLWDAFKTISREEGWRGFYKGLGPALLLTSHGSIQFASYEAMKEAALTNLSTPVTSTQPNTNPSSSRSRSSMNDRLPPWISMSIGGISKIIASTVTYPYQVIKSRMQQRPVITSVVRGEAHLTNYRTMLECTRYIIRNEGMQGFFRGLVPNALKVAPGAAITFLAYEECMGLF